MTILKMISMKREKNRAFTLIELLVVISIIALLLSILMPSLNKVKESARRVVCSTGLRQITFGILLYANDHEKTPSWGWQFNEDNWTSPTDDQLEAFAKGGTVWPYIESEDVFLCPSTPKRFEPGEFGHGANIWGWDPEPRWTYVLNSTPGFHEDPTRVLPNGLLDWGFKISKVNPNPENVMMIFEQNMSDYHSYDNSINIFAPHTDPPTIGHDSPAFYHSEGSNLAYYDGHVEWEKRDEFMASISTYKGFMRRCGPSAEYLAKWP